tara:strand:- start:587 stop:979 length:393 start_codon:yes stop_codon:yes gene_type:complete
MKGFLERLTGVIHWIGFGVSLYLVYFIYFEYPSDSPLWFDVLMILIPNTIGWLIKYIVTGNSNFLPFEESKPQVTPSRATASKTKPKNSTSNLSELKQKLDEKKREGAGKGTLKILEAQIESLERNEKAK